MNNQELLKLRHGEQIEDARKLLQLLTARLDEEAAMTDYNWCHVGDIAALVDDLRKLGPYWVGDEACEDQ